MSYTPGSILTRSEPLPDIERDVTQYDTKTGDAIGAESRKFPHPLNHIRIVAPSPIARGSTEEWTGVAGDHVVVAPVDEFGSNEIAPIAKLMADYDVTDYIEEEAPKGATPLKRGQRLESPEEAFARASREDLKAKKARKAVTA